MVALSEPYLDEDLLHFDQIVEGRHTDPHLFLGLHALCNIDKKIIRIYCPESQEHYFQLNGEIQRLDCIDPRGLFVKIVESKTKPQDYKVYNQQGQLIRDPYTFEPSFGVLDQYFFSKGVHYDLYQKLGAQFRTIDGVNGISFSVWAPNAKRVSVIGDFNSWDGRCHTMRVLGDSGVYEIFIPNLTSGLKYKFQITTLYGSVVEKADPYAFYSEMRPKTASVIENPFDFAWTDEDWINQRHQLNIQSSDSFPMSVYEVHLGSWQRHPDGSFHTYADLEKTLVPYCKEMGFTHIEIMPVMEHPLDESWGYQTTSYFAPTSRYGSLKDFQKLINSFHNEGIGVILDWVPGHFPADDFSLKMFDGSPLYEHCDPKEGWHPHWNTCIFNHSRHEVANFLLSSALFWIKIMHVDALRVDAVSSMLYRDYGRDSGAWIPNCYGGKENLESIDFLKHLNSIIHQEAPGVLVIAEESTAFTGITTSLSDHGLGFDMKWNMGWMNDTLRYFSRDTIYRKYHHSDLTFGLLYAFSEKFMLALSHDEIVHGKKSLLAKMPGDWWQKFANLRLLYSYMFCQPGKKLLFMGGEFGQWNEWSVNKELDWWLCQRGEHASIKLCIEKLNRFYRNNSALWSKDFSPEGFEWISHENAENSFIAYLRKSNNQILLCTHNFTPQYFPNYQLPFFWDSAAREVFNTDSYEFGGSGKINDQIIIPENINGNSKVISVKIAPLSTQVFQIDI